MTVILFGNRVFADVIKLRILGWDHPGFTVGPKANGWCPYKRKSEGDLHISRDT